MYRDVRPAEENAVTASTPEAWAEVFARPVMMSRWKAFRFSGLPEWRLIRKYVPRGGRVLDGGCGAGEWVSFLNGNGYTAEGVDFSSAIIERLRRMYPAFGWTQGDIRSMPYPAESFDAVVSWGVIEHDEEGPGAALREFHRILRKGGVIIVTVPVDSPAQRKSAEVLYRVPGAPHAFFQYLMSDAELRQHVSDAGFTIVASGTLPGAVLNIAAPSLAKRARGIVYRVANLAVGLLFSRMERYRVMRYCVARKS